MTQPGKSKFVPVNPATVRSEVFPADWITLPRRAEVVGSKPSRYTRFSRALIVGAYDPRYYARYLTWSGLNNDERWVAVVTRFTRGAYVYRNRVLRQHPVDPAADNPDDSIPSTYRPNGPNVPGYPRIGKPRPDPTCRPPGFVLSVETDWFWCNSRACLFCHTRRMTELYAALHKAWTRRPDGITVYVSRGCGVGKVTEMTRAARTWKVAAAAGFSLPVRPSAAWGWSAVFLSDDPGRLRRKGLGRPVAVDRPGRLFSVCLAAFRYPRAFAAGAVPGALLRAERRMSNVPNRTVTTLTLGACRDDYTPGKGFFDYAAFEPKS